jgi:hypothetical protein
LIGVVQQSSRRTATFPHHVERLDLEMAIVDGADRPAYDEPRKQIGNRRRYKLPALADGKRPRVAYPTLIRRLGDELAIEKIRRDGSVVIAHCGAREPLPRPAAAAARLPASSGSPASDSIRYPAQAGPRGSVDCHSDACSLRTTCAPGGAVGDRAAHAPIQDGAAGRRTHCASLAASTCTRARCWSTKHRR